MLACISWIAAPMHPTPSLSRLSLGVQMQIIVDALRLELSPGHLQASDPC
jgi:hypothetical protein